MSETIPTTEEICDRASRTRTYPAFASPTLQADFHRWLAAHDAEVRADEREKCARIADRYATAPGRPGSGVEAIAARDVAARIRDD